VADRYWVGGTGTWNTSSTANWSASSGGASGASVPTAADSVFFDQVGTYTVTMTGTLRCLDITVSAGTVTFVDGTTPTLAVSGSMSLVSATVWSATGTITFNATTTGKTVTTNSVTINGSITFDGVGGEWTLQDAMTVGATRTVTLTNGTLALSTFTLTTGFFSSNNSNIRTIAFGTGNIIVIGAGGTLWTTATVANLTTTGTQVVNVSYTGAAATTVASGSLNEANSISFNFTAGTYALTDSGNKRNLNFTGFAGTVNNASRSIYGDLNLGSTATFTGGINAWTLASTSAGRTITTNNTAIDFPLTFTGVGGSWILQDALTNGATRTVTLNSGTLDLGGFTLTTGFFTSDGGNVRTIAFGTGNITVIGAGGTLWNTNTTNNLTTTGSKVVNVSYTGVVAVTINPGFAVTEAQAFSFNFTAGTYALNTGGGGKLNLNFTGFAGTVSNSAQSIYGNLNLGSTATFTGGTGTFTFRSTSAGRTITTNAITIDFPLIFSGVGGSWALQDALTTGATRTVALNDGTLDLGAFTLTTGFFTSATATARTIAFGTGNITVIGAGGTLVNIGATNLTTTGTQVVNVSYTGAAATTVSSGGASEANSISFNFTAGTYALSHTAGTKRSLNFTGFAGTVNNSAQTFYGDLNLGSTATFTGGTNAWTFASTSAGNTITSNSTTIDFPLNFNGVGGGWILQDALTCGSSRLTTHTNGTIDLNGKTLTVGTSYATAAGTKNLTFNGGTLVCPAASTTAFNNAAPTGFTTTAGTGTGTISMTAATGKTFVGGGSTFNCTLNQGGLGALTITGSNTFDNITNTTQPASVLFTAGTTSTFNNFNLNGTPGNLITIASTTLATHTLSKASGIVSCDYLSISYSTATGGAFWYAGANSLNVIGNTGWIFTAAPIQPDLYTNTNVFYAATVTPGAVTLSPDLYDNTNVFYAATISTANSITPARYDNTNAFYVATVTPGAVTLSPARYDNTNVFYAAAISLENSITPARYDNTNVFYAATVTPGAVTLSPARYDNTNVFYAAAVNAVNLVTPARYNNTNVFYAATVTPGAVTLLPARYDNTNVFYAAAISTANSITPARYDNTNAFYTATLTPGIVAPARYDNTNVFYAAAISTANSVTPARYDNTNVFYAAAVNAVNPVTPARYDNTNVFYAATLTPGIVAPARYNNINVFFGAYLISFPPANFTPPWARQSMPPPEEQPRGVFQITETPRMPLIVTESPRQPFDLDT